MTLTLDTSVDGSSALGRACAISAGDVSVAVRTGLARLLAAAGGDRRKAVPLGLAKLVENGALREAEASDLGALLDVLFDSPDPADHSIARRVRAYYRELVLDLGSSPAALAIMSVINSFYASPVRGSESVETAAAAVSGTDALFGGFGAVVGAGIGSPFGPIGVAVGAVAGAAVGVCIEKC